MSLTGWIIAGPFIALAWAMYWTVVVAVKVIAWLIAALVTWLSQRADGRSLSGH
jgi:hypothetical protein